MDAQRKLNVHLAGKQKLVCILVDIHTNLKYSFFLSALPFVIQMESEQCSEIFYSPFGILFGNNVYWL